MKITVGEDDEAAVLCAGVGAGLFFAHERVETFGFGFEDDQRETFLVKQQEVDEATRGFFKVLTECIQGLLGNFYTRLKLDVGAAVHVVEETPTSLLKHAVDLDAGGSLFGLRGCCVFAPCWHTWRCRKVFPSRGMKTSRRKELFAS